jgi:hypothetical protein
MMGHLVDFYSESSLLTLLGGYIKNNIYGSVETEQLLSAVGSSIKNASLNVIMYFASNLGTIGFTNQGS